VQFDFIFLSVHFPDQDDCVRFPICKMRYDISVIIVGFDYACMIIYLSSTSAVRNINEFILSIINSNLKSDALCSSG
jgi:hypothetical protein